MTSIQSPRVILNARVPMRDGVHLATTVVLPEGNGPFPVVFVRTPYNRVPFAGFVSPEWTARGMAFVVQDCRGRYGSEGEFYPWLPDRNDGLDTLDWIAKQEWCNGRIGMFGDSYLGGVQSAVAAPGHPALCVLNPRFVTADIGHCFQRDGVFTLALVFSWLCLEVGERSSLANLLPLFDVPQLMRHLPVETLDEAIGEGVLQPYRDFVQHETGDEYWQPMNFRPSLSEATAPMLFTGGWYDYYAGGAARDFEAACATSDRALAAKHRLLIGPWTHGISPTSQLGDVDFGATSHQEDDATERWLDCLLRDGEPQEFQKAPVRLFVMGENVWRDEWEWPLKRAQNQAYFLHANGQLNREAPGDETPDEYVYDPANPVPTYGGNHSVGPYNPGLYEHALPGPLDQKRTEARDDVLIYSSDVLQEDLEVTGYIQLKLFAASSAPDTDWVGRLCDVDSDGCSINIAEGVLRARFRDLKNGQQLIEPNRVYEYSLDLQATSNVFKRGHRVRLQITSSNFPLWDRNLNMGAPIAGGTEFQSAQQTIHHDAAYPSHLILPVIPRRN